MSNTDQGDLVQPLDDYVSALEIAIDRIGEGVDVAIVNIDDPTVSWDSIGSSRERPTMSPFDRSGVY